MFIHQRAARIARLHRQADLKITRVILRAGQRRDFSPRKLGCESLDNKSAAWTKIGNATLLACALSNVQLSVISEVTNAYEKGVFLFCLLHNSVKFRLEKNSNNSGRGKSISSRPHKHQRLSNGR
jgi:hypothetical protein